MCIGFAALTVREHEVLRYVAAGWTDRKIADEIYISVRTVRTHMYSILRKLQMRNRTEAAILALLSGVITTDEAWELFQRNHPNYAISIAHVSLVVKYGLD